MADFNVGQSIGVNAAGSAINAAFSLAGQALDYNYSKKLAQQQNQYNLDMWNMQNAYNSPQAQMQRLQEAGLNPNLMYGQGTPGNATSAPEMVTPQNPQFGQSIAQLAHAGDPVAILALASMQQDFKKKQADADLASINASNAFDERVARQVFHELNYDVINGTWQHLDPETQTKLRGNTIGWQFTRLFSKALAETAQLRTKTEQVQNLEKLRENIIARTELSDVQKRTLLNELDWYKEKLLYNQIMGGIDRVIRVGEDVIKLKRPSPSYNRQTYQTFQYNY